MPHATNRLDGTRVSYLDPGGSRPVVLCYGGFAVPVSAALGWPLARALADEFRVVWVDHRGMGDSDQPRDVEAYAMPTLVGDVVAVLDALGVERAHFAAYSWGARLGFGVAEHAPERLRALVVGGQHPYALDVRDPFVEATRDGLAEARTAGIDAYLSAIEQLIGTPLPEPASLPPRNRDKGSQGCHLLDCVH